MAEAIKCVGRRRILVSGKPGAVTLQVRLETRRGLQYIANLVLVPGEEKKLKALL